MGGDVHRLDVAQMGDAMRAAPIGEAGRGLRVGLAGVRVSDMGGEELEGAAGGAGIADQHCKFAQPTHRIRATHFEEGAGATQAPIGFGNWRD